MQRAIKAAIGAGMKIDRVEIEPATGKIVLVALRGEEIAIERGTEYTTWRRKRDAREAERTELPAEETR
jgi:hypothetical protein